MDEACGDKPFNFLCKITDRGLVYGALKVLHSVFLFLFSHSTTNSKFYLYKNIFML